MKKLVLAALFCGMAALVWGQESTDKPQSKKERRDAKREKINQLIRQEEEGEIVFRKQNVWGFKMITDGYGFSYEHGRYRNNRKTVLFQFEFNERKHPKEKKVSLFDGFGFSNIIYGKTNNFYQAKLGMALQNRIGGKGNKNGVAVTGILGGGLSLGLLKPYLVDVQINGEQVEKTYPEIIDSGYAFIGAAGFFRGWNQVSVKPGLHAKAAMRFDYGRFHETVTAVEVGLAAEYYTSKISQMAYISQKQFFFNAYISLLIGRRK